MKVKNLIKYLQTLDPNADIDTYPGSLFQYKTNRKIEVKPTVYARTEWSDGSRHWERLELIDNRPNRRGLICSRKILKQRKTVYLL